MHYQAARAVEESSKGDSHSADAQSGQAVAALQREEAVLSQQAAQLNAQVKTTLCGRVSHSNLALFVCTCGLVDLQLFKLALIHTD